jgi:hypothetical protein
MKISSSWVAILGAVALSTAAASTNTRSLSFDSDQRLPAGWRADATGGKTAEWKIVRHPQAISAPNVLSIARFHETSRGAFNLFWTSDTRFLNGSIEVSIRAQTGEIDRGGGLIWRARDANNYYIARYNPLEKNLRLYYVLDGSRRMLADAPNLNIGSDEWFTLKVAHRGAQIEVWLNGNKLIEKTDMTFTDAGGIGVWTKADANSAFDNLKVQEEN